MEHGYTASGWCRCGHHRDDGRNERDHPPRLTREQIRDTLTQHGPAYEPRDQP